MSKGIKVLLVDDDARNIRILEEVLSDDFILEKAVDGDSALECVSSFSPDIILLDVMMPGIDGLEVCRRIRKHDDFHYMKIILVSGKARLEERLEGYAAGADDYVTKPFDHMELLAKVNVYAKLKTIEEVDRLKTDFLSLISHETGTPLNAIIGFSNLLLYEGTLNDDQKDMVSEILEAGEYLHEKVSRILLLSTLRKTEDYSRTEVFSSDLVDTALQEMKDAITAKDIKIVKPQVDGFKIHGNYELLQKSLVFLLENAIKLSPEGSTVAFRQYISEDKKHYAIQLKDSGPGIDEKFSDMLFQEFRVANINQHGNGLGISLALTKLIVEMHGGRVCAENDSGQGATFTITFPAED